MKKVIPPPPNEPEFTGFDDSRVQDFGLEEIKQHRAKQVLPAPFMKLAELARDIRDRLIAQGKAFKSEDVARELYETVKEIDDMDEQITAEDCLMQLGAYVCANAVLRQRTKGDNET